MYTNHHPLQTIHPKILLSLRRKCIRKPK